MARQNLLGNLLGDLERKNGDIAVGCFMTLENIQRRFKKKSGIIVTEEWIILLLVPEYAKKRADYIHF